MTTATLIQATATVESLQNDIDALYVLDQQAKALADKVKELHITSSTIVKKRNANSLFKIIHFLFFKCIRVLNQVQVCRCVR